jgi:hypothetical protein
MKTEKTLRIIYYTRGNDPSGKRMERVIGTQCTDYQIDICKSLKMLSERLRHPVRESTIIVLLAASRKEFMRILALREWLLEYRLILILPDDDPVTTSEAHKLRPRFLTYKSSDFSDVSMVLERMIRHCELHLSKIVLRG